MPEAAGVFPLREHDEKKTGREKNKPAGKPDTAPTFSFSAPPVPKHPPPEQSRTGGEERQRPAFSRKKVGRFGKLSYFCQTVTIALCFYGTERNLSLIHI